MAFCVLLHLFVVRIGDIVKVLTVKQPYASLIANGYKKYEFRSWKTNYRGELYIHAGKGIDKDCMNRISKYNMQYLSGYIIAKVNLTDCILVDKKMDDELRKINTDVYDHDHTGYYAWKLEDVKILEKPIKVKGKLSIWYYDGDEMEK